MNIHALKAALDKRDREIDLLRDTLHVTASMLAMEANSHKESGDPQRLRYVDPLLKQVAHAHAVANGEVQP